MTRAGRARAAAAIIALAAVSGCAGSQLGLGAVDGGAGPEYRRAHLEVENSLAEGVLITLLGDDGFGDRRLGTVPSQSSRSFDVTLRSSVRSVHGSSTVEVLARTEDESFNEVYSVMLAPNSVSRIVVGPREGPPEGSVSGDD